MRHTAWLLVAVAIIAASTAFHPIQGSPPPFQFDIVVCGESEWEDEPTGQRPRWLSSSILVYEHAHELLENGLGDQISQDNEYPVFIGGFPGLPATAIGWIDFEYTELDEIKDIITRLNEPPDGTQRSFQSQMSVSVVLTGTVKPPPIPDHIVRRYRGPNR